MIDTPVEQFEPEELIVRTVRGLAFGNDDEETLDQQLARYFSRDARQRINGEGFDLSSYRQHVEQMRDAIVGGSAKVQRAIGTPTAAAVIFDYRFELASGGVRLMEGSVVAEFDQTGRITWFHEVALELPANS